MKLSGICKQKLINNKIKLSIEQEVTTLVNVTLNFSADTVDGTCVAKRFIIQSSPDLASPKALKKKLLALKSELRAEKDALKAYCIRHKLTEEK